MLPLPRATMEDRDVVIIGAGMAGLACAQRLTEANVDFVVLEAADRIGGRVRTDYTVAAGRPLEIGALMIHGRNVVTHDWVLESGLHARPLPLMRRARFLFGGHVRRLPSVDNLLHRTVGLRAFYQGGVSLPRAIARYRGPDISLAEYLDREAPLPGARSIVELLYAHAAATSPETIGMQAQAEESAAATEEFGYRNFQVVEGYEELLRRRGASLAGRIRLRAAATAVHRAEGRVAVQVITDGSPLEVRAKRAVVTVPLTVLRAGAISFDPPLPADKLEALRAIGMGEALVVAMRLRGGNLFERLGDFGTLWAGTASTFQRAYVGVRDAPPVITAFVVGEEARKRSELPDGEVVAATLEELRSILPEGVTPGTVEAHAIGRWSTNPWVRGAYTYPSLGSGMRHRRNLAAPVDGVLFFAGEATHYGGEAATVHGAIETGYRAADEVLASLRPT